MNSFEQRLSCQKLKHNQVEYNFYIFKILSIMSLASLILATYSTSSVLYTYRNQIFPFDISKDIRIIASKAKALRSRQGERQRLNTDYGAWFLTRNDDDLLFAVCVSDDYPQRTAFGLIKKVETVINEKKKEGTLEKRIKKVQSQINSLCDKYKDPIKVDKVREAQHEVDDLKGELNKGIRSMFQNQQNLNKLSEKTGLMIGYAKQFEKTSEEAEQKAFWHKWKAFLIVGIIIGSVLIVCGIVLYLRLK